MCLALGTYPTLGILRYYRTKKEYLDLHDQSIGFYTKICGWVSCQNETWKKRKYIFILYRVSFANFVGVW